MLPKASRLALLIALTYVSVGIGWALASDALLKTFVSGADARIYLDVIKDAGFTVLTGVLLYVVVARLLTRIESEAEQREQAERAKGDSEKLYRQLFAVETDAILIMDRQNHGYLEVNPAAEQMYGYTQAEFLRLKPADLSAEPEKTIHAIDSELKHVPSRLHRCKDGTVFPVEISCCDFTHQNRQIHVAVMRDITARKRAEAALRESEEKYRGLFEGARDAIITTDPTTGKFVSGNPAALRMFGVENEAEFIAHGPADFSPERQPDGRRSVEATRLDDAKTLANGSRFFEWTHRRTSGEEFVADVLLTRLEQGGKVLVMATVRDITARKRADAEMNLQLSALTAAANAIVITDRKGKIKWVNPAFTRLTGYSAAEAIGCSPRVLKSGEHPPAFYANLWATIVTGNIWQGEIINRRKDGGLYTEDMTITPVREADGQIAHFVAVKQDITGRKLTERLLEFVAQEGWDGKQEDFLARLVEYIGGIMAVDYVFIGRSQDDQTIQTTGLYAKGRIVPDMKYSTRGAPCANVIGKTLCHYGDKLQELFPEDKLLVEMGAQSYLGIPLTDSAGQPLGLMAMLHSKPLPDAPLAAAMLRIASVRVAGEIERRAKADELRWKTALMEAQIESAPDGILVVDKLSRKILQNRRMIELWKIPPEIVANQSDAAQREFVTGRTKNPGAFAERVAYLYSHRDEVSRDEVEVVDGTILDRYSSPVWDKVGNYCGRIWIFRDITKSRLMESQLRQAQKMEAIGTLAGGIAHDFNNILGAMFGYGYLLQQDTEGNIAAQESLAEIMKSATRAKDLVQQILTFSRQREQQRHVIPLDTVVAEATKLLRASLPADIIIEMNLAADAPTVLADPTQIYQVTMNLATNALHALEGRGGRLTVNLESFQPDEEFIRTHPEFRPVQYARLTVADTGRGMDAKTLERIFDPFFTTKPVGKGTGLGLAVVHGIVESHEGVISVQSVVGQGTTFRLYFPAQTNGATPTAAVNGGAGKGRGQKILLLDDESAVTAPFQRLLERLEYDVTVSNSAREAVGLVRENSARFDLVITDLTMPEMSGLEVARQLRGIRPNLPVILTSGFTPDLNREELRAEGICELLEKPVTMTGLTDALQRTLVKEC
ncbi:MAG: PAS domain S-box protein [Verrucomicrobiota bacterium]